jgi:methylmalonyl-CoA mutase N-terminal domain/subunit
MLLRFHTQTAGSTLTAQQPENNVARVTIQALAAVMGGTQSLHTNSMDEALWLPTEKAVRVALRTQQTLRMNRVWLTGRSAGWFVCGGILTDEIAKQASEYIQKIDEMGGALKAIENGYIQSEIQESAYQYQKAVENKQAIVVGVNEFGIDEKIEWKAWRLTLKLRKTRLQSLIH